MLLNNLLLTASRGSHMCVDHYKPVQRNCKILRLYHQSSHSRRARTHEHSIEAQRTWCISYFGGQCPFHKIWGGGVTTPHVPHTAATDLYIGHPTSLVSVIFGSIILAFCSIFNPIR